MTTFIVLILLNLLFLKLYDNKKRRLDIEARKREIEELNKDRLH